MTVQDCRTECGKRSEGKTPKNDFIFLRLHNICVVSIRNPSKRFGNNLCGRNFRIRGRIYT